MDLLSPYKIIEPVIKSGRVYYFTTDSGIKYEVQFGRKEKNILHTSVVFGVINDEFDGEEYILTNKGEVYKVLSTVLHIMKIFDQEHPKNIAYEFTGEYKINENHQSISQRTKFYSRYLQRFLTANWKMHQKGNTVIISRNKMDKKGLFTF